MKKKKKKEEVGSRSLFALKKHFFCGRSHIQIVLIAGHSPNAFGQSAAKFVLPLCQALMTVKSTRKIKQISAYYQSTASDINKNPPTAINSHQSIRGFIQNSKITIDFSYSFPLIVAFELQQK
jgi:hypothetical protein